MYLLVNEASYKGYIVTIQLNSEEIKIAQQLSNAGLAHHTAALAVVMVTREHSRPETELIDIVRQYQGLESPSNAQSAVQELKTKGWLVESKSYGVTLLQQHTHLRKKIADTLDNPSIKDTLKTIRSAVDPYASILGPMSDDSVYTTYLELLRTAGSEICLPMLATTPKLSSVPTLKERAQNGVKVRILLGSPSVVASLRGNTMKTMAKEAIRGWKTHAVDSSNIEIRIVRNIPDTYLATCMLIDHRILRFDVYDPHRQRSLQGTMLEFDQVDDLEFNISRLFRIQFEEIWRRACPVGSWDKFIWYLKRFWNIWVALVVSIVAVVIQQWKGEEGVWGVWLGIGISISAGFWINGIYEAKNDIREWIKGWI